MGALLIVNYDTTDREALDKYREAALPLLVGPGLGQAVAVSSTTVDLNEGTPAGKDTVVLRFSSVESAQAAFSSDEYLRVLPDRLNATIPKIAFIVETLD